jgi:hypothetical protein
MSPFDIVNQICTTKEDYWDEIEDKDYVPFMINRSLSYHHDCIMIASIANHMHTAPKRWQYDLLRLSVTPKKKRFSKWAKPEEDKLIELISETYQVNRHRAISIRKFLNEGNINTLKEKTNRGGR